MDHHEHRALYLYYFLVIGGIIFVGLVWQQLCLKLPTWNHYRGARKPPRAEPNTSKLADFDQESSPQHLAPLNSNKNSASDTDIEKSLEQFYQELQIYSENKSILRQTREVLQADVHLSTLTSQ